jgi:ribose transport system permease protein
VSALAEAEAGVTPPQHSSFSLSTSMGRGATRVFASSEAGIVIAVLALVGIFYLINPAFLNDSNIRAMLGAMSFVGIIGVGQTLLLVAGEFDLSVGSVAGLSAIVAGTAMTKGHLPVAVGLIGGLLLGGLLGLVNGTIVVRIGIPAFVTTLGMLYAAQGITYLVTDGYPVYPLPKVIGEIGQFDGFFGFGWSVLILVILVAVGDFFLRRTTYGRNLYATGGNKEVARLVGINTDLYKIACFVLTGALSAVAGMLVMSYIGSGTPTIGGDWTLIVIAGVVIGGVSLFGGVGTVVAGAIGMLLLQVVQSGLVVSDVSPHWQVVAVGVIMVLAVGVDLVRRRLSAEQSPRWWRRFRARRGAQTKLEEKA